MWRAPVKRPYAKLFSIVVAFAGANLAAQAQTLRSYDQTPIENPALEEVHPKVTNAVRLAYASAYWETALRLTRTDGVLRNQFWTLADQTLAGLPQDEADVAEVRRVLNYVREHPGDTMGWFDRERHDDWIMRIGYRLPPDVLNHQFYGGDRRTCRIVMAIALDRAMQELAAFENDPSPENYWALSIASDAGFNAFNGCPEPGSTENALLMDFAQALNGVRATAWLHTEDYWPKVIEPPQYPLIIDPGAGYLLQTEPNVATKADLQAVSNDLSERALRVWRSGPDNPVLKLWNRTQRILEEWPD